MAKQVPLINREKELGQIDALIREWNTRRVCCIHGPGGIGKTRLLQEIRSRYLLSAPFFVPDRIERKDITIALVQEFTASEWSKEFIAGARGMANELGVNLDETDARFDLDRMASDLESVILKSPDAIIVRLGSSEKLRAGIQRAIEQGIKVLTLDNYLKNIDGLTTRVTLEYESKGGVLFEKLAEDMNFQGKVAAVWVKSETIQKRRRNILEAVLLRYPDLELVAEFGVMGRNMAEDIYRKTKEVLHDYPDLQAIWVTWDEFTKGVVRALIEEGRTDISVYGFDLCQSDVDLMLQPDSPWRATVATNPAEVGRIIIRLTTQAAYGIEIEQYRFIPMELITQESLRKTVTDKLPLWSESDIGWTPWLRSLQIEGRPEEEKRLLVTDIVDFDDRAFHIPQNLGHRIATELSEEAFEPYMRGLLDWRKMEIASVSPEVLEQQSERVNQILVDNFNEVSSKWRVVLLLDTTDALEGTDVWNYMGNLALQMENVLFLVAGRNAKVLWKKLKSEIGEDAQLIELLPLETEASEQYLQQKQKLLHVTLAPEIAQKLLLLVRGRPILIDLAVEWTAREIPLDWLVEESLTQLKGLSDKEMKERQKEFEYQLVHQIADIRTQMDRLILVLSHVYPLDREMIVELLGLSEDEAEELLEEAQIYVFVKSLPDGRISLHDEMRRIVNEHVWPEVDPDGDRQRRYSQLAAEYLKRKVQALKKRINQLEEEDKIAREEKDVEAELSVFVEREALERELWVLEERQLRHILLADLDEGVKTFAEMFDEATRAYRFLFRETLLAQMRQYVDRLSPEQMYELDSRRVKFLLDRGGYSQAKELATEILGRENILPKQQVDMLIERGNAEIRLGNLDKGISDFESAVQISQDHNLPNWLVRSLNARGWAYRNQGNYELALADYLVAYKLSLQLGDRQRTAWILNNMGYVNAFEGNRQAAFENCWAALELWKEMDFGRGMGATYSTLGEIFRRFDQPTEAMTYYNEALDIFTDENDVEWMSIVRCGRASVFLVRGELDKAKEDLNWALANGPLNLRPRILHYQAQLYLAKNELTNARQQFEECRKISQEIGDNDYDYRSFADLIGLAWEFSEYDRWREFDDELKKLYADRKSEDDFRLRGSCLRKIGDLAICNGDYDSALTAYKEGLSLIAKYEVHGPYMTGEQMRQTDTRVRKCTTEDVLRNLGGDLSQFWRDEEELVTRYPEALLIFDRWQRGGEIP